MEGTTVVALVAIAVIIVGGLWCACKVFKGTIDDIARMLGL